MRALVLTPTRELAVQVAESFRDYGKHLPLRSTVVYGGVDMNAQIEQLRKGVEILVATPGRLLDHVQNKTVMFNQVSVLVLDEADRMLDMGFLPDIKRIIALLPPRSGRTCCSRRRSRTRSATLAKTHAAQSRPRCRSRRATPPPTSSPTCMHPVAREKKRELLCLPHPDARPEAGAGVLPARASAPTASPTSCARDHIQADAIHGDKSQAEREAALDDFKAGKTTVLVATDVASRGLDIEGLPQVINFDVPHSPEDYVHRIGRTGRAGLTGEAISLVAPEDHDAIAAIERADQEAHRARAGAQLRAERGKRRGADGRRAAARCRARTRARPRSGAGARQPASAGLLLRGKKAFGSRSSPRRTSRAALRSRSQRPSLRRSRSSPVSGASPRSPLFWVALNALSR